MSDYHRKYDTFGYLSGDSARPQLDTSGSFVLHLLLVKATLRPGVKVIIV